MQIPRLTRTLALSAALHFLGMTAIGFGARFSWPAPPIPVEIRPLHRTIERTDATDQRKPATDGRDGAPGTAADTPAKTVSATGNTTRRRPASARARVARSIPQTTDLSPFAPDGAQLVILLRADKLRASPHRRAIEALLSAFPDYERLLAGTGLSLLDDFQALLIATSDPRDVTATFLAATCKQQERVRAALEDKTLPAGDPRVLRFIGPRLITLARPEDATKLDAAGKAGATPHGASGERAVWLAQLAKLDQLPAGAEAPALLVTLHDAPALLRLGAGLPTPQALALAATADTAPALRVEVRFAVADEARRFAAAWPGVVRRWRSLTALIGLSSALDGLRLRQREKVVEVEGLVAGDSIELGLSWARAFLPSGEPEIR